MHQARRKFGLEEPEVRQIANLLKQGQVKDVQAAINHLRPLANLALSSSSTSKSAPSVPGSSGPDTLALENALNQINRLLRQALDRYVHLREQGWHASSSVEKALAEVHLLLQALDESRRL